MNERMSHLLNQLNELEIEIQSEVNKQKELWFYQLHGKRVKFESSIIEAHRTLKLNIFRWFLTVHPLDYLTAPIIYSMSVPMIAFDLCVSFYQLTCFPIYGIARVRRADYFAFDHRHLAYLNVIEKFNCLYCSYGNGLLAYATEIVARTEQYFCPIKHAQKTFGKHSRYQYFLEYGDASELQQKFRRIRAELLAENKQKSN